VPAALKIKVAEPPEGPAPLETLGCPNPLCARAAVSVDGEVLTGFIDIDAKVRGRNIISGHKTIQAFVSYSTFQKTEVTNPPLSG